MHDELKIQAKNSLAARAAYDRARRVAKRLAGNTNQVVDAPAVEALDEAFAGFHRVDGQIQRVDAAVSASVAAPGTKPGADLPAAGWAQIKHAVAADLAGQLTALDSQRERLARLLRTIADDSAAS